MILDQKNNKKTIPAAECVAGLSLLICKCNKNVMKM